MEIDNIPTSSLYEMVSVLEFMVENELTLVGLLKFIKEDIQKRESKEGGRYESEQGDKVR